MIPIEDGPEIIFLNISEKSIEVLKRLLRMSLCLSASVSSSAHQNFLIAQKQRQVHTLVQSLEECEVDR